MEEGKKVLVAIDLNFETSYILSAAASFFRETPAKFYVFHVISADPFSFVNKKSALETRSDEAYKLVETALKEAGLYYMNYEILVSPGMPAPEILNFSRKKAIDLIVIGTHQKIGLKEFVSGSVSFSVAKNSVCPVLLIPLKNTVKKEEELVKESAVSLINNPS